ncbi:MAG TPA: acyl-CoA dehydrogenase, partial [Acidimicrobiaceae bacterium]|nr:acyl-CoA dehydrogenase [Acidimicrobiaceae bacterium]
HERGGIDRLVSNKRLYEDCLEFVRAHGGLEDPNLRQEIAEIESMYRIGRLLVLRETLQQA